MMQHPGSRRESLEDQNFGQQMDDNLSDDDNAAPEMETNVEEREDPLFLALEDLEGRVVNALDDVKMHPGVRSAPEGPSVHEELATLLRPVLEVAAHTGPSVARTYYSPLGASGEGVEASCEAVYERLVSDLVLPVILEMAQSETIPSKRAASLEFFHSFWKELHKAGSWLDNTTQGPNAGPYGSGGGGGHSANSMNTPALRAQHDRRRAKRLAREGEVLRYWVQASIACTVPGAFTSNVSEDSVASRGVIAASASFRPSLRHIAQRIQDADDRGAARLYSPVMKMVGGVLNKLFVNSAETGEALRSACIKFLEIVAVCCSSRGEQETTGGRRRVSSQNTDGFALEDLPIGHPIITREALESISDYAFTTLRGLVLMGGQVKIDLNLLSETMLGSDGTPSAQVVSVLKPAALAFLSAGQADATDLQTKVDRSNVEFDFVMMHKSYALAINAISMLATHRPVFYREAATCLGRRVTDPPTEDSSLSKTNVKALVSHLRASCLTLLRNPLSVATNGHEILHEALSKFDMKIQADKALSMARQAAALKTAGRAARNRAAMFYEWDASEGDRRITKRQRETDDALAKMRAAKAARGLGHGIQLPTNMVDAIELILLNLSHLPAAKPSGAAKNRKQPFTFDFLVDAVMSNGSSLSHDEGQWYERDGGNAWNVDLSSEPKYRLDEKVLLAAQSEHDKAKLASLGKGQSEKLPAVFQAQCQEAASQAFQRILKTTIQTRDRGLAQLGSKVAARLAWTLRNVKANGELKPQLRMAEDILSSVGEKVDSKEAENLSSFVETFPLVSACLTLGTTPDGLNSSALPSLPTYVLNEAYMITCRYKGSDETWNSRRYEEALSVLAASTLRAGELANEKANDAEKKKAAATGTGVLTSQLAVLPSVTESSLRLLCGLCDVEDISKRAFDASRKTSQQTIAAAAALNAAKLAAEKRATAALVALRDVAFQRSKPEIRRCAVTCAVSVAAGRMRSSSSIEEKALKLVMNVLYQKSELLASLVLEAATIELDRAAKMSIEKYEEVQEANKQAQSKSNQSGKPKSPWAPCSDVEKSTMDQVKKPAVVFMALCARRPEMIRTLFSMGSQPKADVLSKAIKENMPKLARAIATKLGAAKVALQVAEMAEKDEIPMVLAFLESLAPMGEKNMPSEDLIEACHKIQETKLTSDGKKDPRFIIPVIAGMKRVALVEKLPEFVSADDRVFMAALARMGDRVARHALVFRDEPDEANPVLSGMTSCEQLVFLHKLDFAAVDIPQKRYLASIRLCLETDDIFTDRVIMAAMDYLSGTFLTTSAELPLAYMRTIMLTCSKHESLHSWICHILLPRLVEGEVFKDRRQWEGWMRCARMLEKPGASGVSSREAIMKLPPEQLQAYRSKYPNES